ncbi:MFS transporter [Streptomyces sp. NBC_00989]|uniref:MFS transporter n=1 Tax=Streptomyces sp. NBC_00989 TaxID=2903705 RepID=UPI00386B1074|nr:MFS transporter [Streptomyces sp. NBC_00989]
MNTWRRMSPAGRVLLTTVLLTGLTTFMFLPLLALEFTAQGVPAARTGFLVGLLAFCGQGFSLVSGLIVDRFGTRSVLTAGFTLRIGGYLLLGVGLGVGGPDGTRLVPLVAGIAAIGVGGSLLGLSVKTLLVTEDGVEPREMLALRSTFVNIGVVAGPALGALVYPLGFGWILGACVLSHLLLGIRLTVRPVRRTAPGPRTPGKDTAARAAGDGWGLWQWLPLCLLGVAYWAIYSQLNVVMPITAERTTGSTAAISVVFIVNGALVVLCQYTLLRHVFHRAQARTLLLAGFLAFALAYAVFIPLTGWFSLFVFVLPVTFAEMLISPSLDEQAVRASSPLRTGLALGTMSAVGAVGSLLGSSMGGYLLQSLSGGSGIWLVLVSLSLCAALTSLLLPKARAQHG